MNRREHKIITESLHKVLNEWNGKFDDTENPNNKYAEAINYIKQACQCLGGRGVGNFTGDIEVVPVENRAVDELQSVIAMLSSEDRNSYMRSDDFMGRWY